MGTGRRSSSPPPASGASRRSSRPRCSRRCAQDIADQLGCSVERAVISVPALFELPQSAATSEAARLAGFQRVELLQEPIASALAAGWRAEDDGGGTWLVFDLGGGTFDASLLETRDGLLRVVGHDGDNFLGGRDFDWAITEHLADRASQVVPRADNPRARRGAARAASSRPRTPRSSCRAARRRRALAQPLGDRRRRASTWTSSCDRATARAAVHAAHRSRARGVPAAAHRARPRAGAARAASCWSGGPTVMPLAAARVGGAARGADRRGARSDDARGAGRGDVRRDRRARRARADAAAPAEAAGVAAVPGRLGGPDAARGRASSSAPGPAGADQARAQRRRLVEPRGHRRRGRDVPDERDAPAAARVHVPARRARGRRRADRGERRRR